MGEFFLLYATVTAAIMIDASGLDIGRVGEVVVLALALLLEVVLDGNNVMGGCIVVELVFAESSWAFALALLGVREPVAFGGQLSAKLTFELT